MKKLSVLIFFIFILSCQNQSSSNWEVAFKNAKDETTLQGSKAELINAIRQGLPIKIGWGSKGKNHRIEHLSDPIWLAVLDEQEVIAHLSPQVLSKVEWDIPNANYSDAKMLYQEWRVVITTKGSFDAVWYDKKKDTLIKRVPQKHPITWFVKKEKGSSEKAIPLFEER